MDYTPANKIQNCSSKHPNYIYIFKIWKCDYILIWIDYTVLTWSSNKVGLLNHKNICLHMLWIYVSYIYKRFWFATVKQGFPSRRHHRKQVTIHQRLGIKEATQRRTIRKSVAVKREKRGWLRRGLELIDQIDGGQIRSRMAGPPWECQLSQSQINLEGKINYALFLLLRALPHAEEDFPIEICKYFSACFVCANDQEIGEFVARLPESKAAIKA